MIFFLLGSIILFVFMYGSNQVPSKPYERISIIFSFQQFKKRFLGVRRSNSAYLIHSLTSDWDGLTQLWDNFLKTKSLEMVAREPPENLCHFHKMLFYGFFFQNQTGFQLGDQVFNYIQQRFFFQKKKNLGIVMDFKKRKIMSQSLRLRLRKSSLYALSEKKLQSPCHGYESCVDITTFLTALSCWGSLPHTAEPSCHSKTASLSQLVLPREAEKKLEYDFINPWSL